MLGVIIAAALVALFQVTAARNGTAGPLAGVAQSLGFGFEEGASAAVQTLRSSSRTVVSLPALQRENVTLRTQNQALRAQNAQLQEQLANYRSEIAIAPQVQAYPHSVQARVIGFPPEGGVDNVTIDKGTSNGIARDDGVLAGPGVVGRVIAAEPFSSQVSLITDFTSAVPAIVARGRHWGIAKGNGDSVRLEYISQDAPLRAGDQVVTAEARSFHSGAVLGTIVKIEHDSALYQTAILKPAVDFSALDRVVVITK